MSMDNGYYITDFVNIAKSKCHINSQKITVNVEKGQMQLMLETSSGQRETISVKLHHIILIPLFSVHFPAFQNIDCQLPVKECGLHARFMLHACDPGPSSGSVGMFRQVCQSMIPRGPFCDYFGGKYSNKILFHKFSREILPFFTFLPKNLEKRGGLASLEENREFVPLEALLQRIQRRQRSRSDCCRSQGATYTVGHLWIMSQNSQVKQ